MVRKGGSDPKIRELAVGELSRRCGTRWCVGEKDWAAEVRALFGLVRRNVRYTRDPLRHDTYVSARRTLGQWHAGDCDDMTIALGALLQSVGYPVALRVVQTVGNTGYNHIYLLAAVPTKAPSAAWLPLDPSVDRPAGWEVPWHTVLKHMDVKV